MSQKVLVAGTGISGIAAAKLLLAKGGEVVLYDGNEKLDAEKIKKNFDEDAKVTLVLGELKRTDLLGVELSVISPGIPMDAPFVAVLDEAGVPIWSEIQLAFHCAKGKLAAITGTNGKTTTTALTGEIMKSFYESVFVVGNIGEPYTAHALETEEDSVTVAEVSSFQLETIMDFRPNVSAILNITPDHLDRHKTMECYIEVKESITKNQKEGDTCVLNYEDSVLREFGETLKINVVYFSSRQTLKKGYYLDDGKIVYNDGSKVVEIVDIHDLKLLGRHNHENVMAAVAISMNMGVPLEKIQEVIKNFEAVEHRIEYVTERFGVKYYNDSKGTNPDAAMQAIKAMPGPTILIAGGYDKHSEFDEWIESFDGKVRYLVLIGQTRDKIAECAKRHGFTDIMYAEDLLEAVQVCASYANPGDNVLLSPACASWGQFKNFEERGTKFKEYVRGL
ncbi:UDP-N-acetylmuramoyl-L-alanine--D-glutamate ligase [[Clostridium] symbiosum]|uniref:UDP-N-acetylmuramoyl-L-alanine--D-glutamate ligase n=1 Tax=Clostridium symbiosum TaxID=1512 RepID=UPI001D07EC09|nr:UDP-N-acetylmuramoyl-L-alanine--D-glutamate ligase [[Clostridium] symbiosum]MCB6607621.1 UDP-N-acetylmuramoyl-L-alanine--D-glutamate ligase [[Clostridium] symbiosum]MCB6929298.1 UDP-N-acetylmuramoyl-L-alanine--D-glutamate ligase [[Clostridium] symbiosum]